MTPTIERLKELYNATMAPGAIEADLAAFDAEMSHQFPALLAHIEGLEKKVAELGKLARRGHYYCEDSWYSCPLAPEGCSDRDQGDKCNCGTDEHNAKVNALLGNQAIGGSHD